ncbi:MAG: DeoR family transcriptional regulator [Promethearchaeota archaeon]
MFFQNKAQIANLRQRGLLVDLLARTDFMEKAGTGIKRVTDACYANGNKCTFHFSDAFWVTIETNVPDKRTELIIDLIKKNNQIHLKDLAITLKVSTRTIRRDIEKLKNMNKLKRIGSEKSGYWKIINDEK